jgi:hypothetical protein
MTKKGEGALQPVWTRDERLIDSILEMYYTPGTVFIAPTASL